MRIGTRPAPCIVDQTLEDVVVAHLASLVKSCLPLLVRVVDGNLITGNVMLYRPQSMILIKIRCIAVYQDSQVTYFSLIFIPYPWQEYPPRSPKAALSHQCCRPANPELVKNKQVYKVLSVDFYSDNISAEKSTRVRPYDSHQYYRSSS